MASDALRRAHEADVDATVRKAKLDAAAEQELHAIRIRLEEKRGRLELERLDRAAKLQEDQEALLEAYRKRARAVGL